MRKNCSSDVQNFFSTASVSKGCHLLVKNWIFDDPFHNKLPVLVILVASDVQTFRIRKFYGGNWALEAVEDSDNPEVAEVNDAGEVSKA